MSTGMFHTTVKGELARLPGPAGERWVSALERGQLSIEVYAPRGDDPQQPHTRDEVYVVVAGRGSLESGTSRVACVPGDVLYFPAGTPHRFVDFSDGFTVWGIFFPPVGDASARSPLRRP